MLETHSDVGEHGEEQRDREAAGRPHEDDGCRRARGALPERERRSEYEAGRDGGGVEATVCHGKIALQGGGGHAAKAPQLMYGLPSGAPHGRAGSGQRTVPPLVAWRTPFQALLAALAAVTSGCDRGTPAVRADTPPPLPPSGTADSLLGLFVVPAESLARFETREHGYEEASAVVYGIADEGRWLLVGLRDSGRAWMRRDAGELLPIEALLRDRLTHLTEDWDRSLRFAPHAGSTPQAVRGLARDADDVPARLLGTRVVDGRLWLEVEVLDRICEGDTPEIVAYGWVPAWTGGKPTMWFYSRGC